MKQSVESKHITTITAGDTVRHAGELRTVSNKDIKRSEFMGLTLFGDSYKLGYQLVIKVKFNKH